MEQIRAVTYCRCSTEEESQIDALSRQVQEGRTCIAEMGWIQAGEYVESKSGTTRKGRTEYNRLFEDLQTDLFDVIVIKSQDRLMRNVKDWYVFLDRMISNGKRLYIYIEHKFYTPDDALITGIKAILAEEYSRELSKKINNAHRHRQKNGGKAMLTSHTYGYKKNSDGSMSIIESEAAVIREIFELSAAGYGCYSIVNILRSERHWKRSGKAFGNSDVGRIIRSALYKGVEVMNRQHYDFETKRTVKVPKEQWIYREGGIPPIVDADLWERANQAMTERAEFFHANEGYKKGSSVGKYDLSGKLVCGLCEHPYYRTWRRRFAKKEQIIVEWKCSNYLRQGRMHGSPWGKKRKIEKEPQDGCDNANLDESVLFALLEDVNRQYYALNNWNRETVLNRAVEILRKVLENEPILQEKERLSAEENKLIKQKDFLLTKYLEGIVSDRDYQRRAEQLEQEISEVRVQQELLEKKEQDARNLERRIETMKERMTNGGIEMASVGQMLQEIKEIRVYEWEVEICFDPLKIADLSESRGMDEGLIQKLSGENFSIRVEYPFPPETERGRYLDRRQIIEHLKKNPQLTAKQMAAIMDRSLPMVINRMEELSKNGYIRFAGKGGKGRWEVLKKLPDKEVSIKTGGL